MTDAPTPASDAVNDLFSAIHANNLPGVQLLITAEPELLEARSPSGLSPVLFAAYYRRPEILRALIGAGAPLNLYEAAAAGEADRVSALLDAQPDLVHTFSPDGFSPLGLAAFFGHDEVAQHLLARGADVNAVSRNAMAVQPLHSAAAGDHTHLALALVQAGAQVNATQHGGFTPLMSAAQNGNAALVAFFLSVGADPAARTPEGHDALALAQESGHEAVSAQLRTAAAERQETRNAPGAWEGHTEAMNKQHKLIGETGAQTGFETPDPKDNHENSYETTPESGKVSSANKMTYEAPEVPDPKEVTGQFDHLATRDPATMEQTLQAAEHAGAQTVGSVDPGLLDLATPVAGIGVNAGLAPAIAERARAVDPNPGYTPPSEKTVPHVDERPGDLPQGERAEVENEVRGGGNGR